METHSFACVLALAAIASSSLASPLQPPQALPPDPAPAHRHDPRSGSLPRTSASPVPVPPELRQRPTGATRGTVALQPRHQPSRPPASIDDILRGSDIVGVMARMESNWELVEADRGRAYERVEAAIRRHHQLAMSPARPIEELLDIRVLHGQAALDLHRLLDRIDPARSAGEECQARLESLRRIQRSRAAAVAVAMAVRQMAFTDWTESPWDEDGDEDVSWASAGMARIRAGWQALEGGGTAAAHWAAGVMLAVGLAGLGVETGCLGWRKPSRKPEGEWMTHDVEHGTPG